MGIPVRIRYARIKKLTALSLIVLTASSLHAVQVNPTRDSSGDSKKSGSQQWAELKRLVYDSISPDEEKGFQRLGEPKRGEWLARVNENPQTLIDYRESSPVRPSAERGMIVLQPLGSMDERQQDALRIMKEYAEAFFQLPARIERPLPLSVPDKKIDLVRIGPHDRHGSCTVQYEADKIVNNILIEHVPDDAVLYLGITASDLWADDGGVFGWANLQRRAGVLSFYRLFPKFFDQKRSPEETLLFLRRLCRVLSHESGHMFGLTHCVFYHCAMNGCNGLAEADSAPLHFCPVCEQKLFWNIRYDPLKRCEALHAFYSQHGMEEEEKLMSQQMQRFHEPAGSRRSQ